MMSSLLRPSGHLDRVLYAVVYLDQLLGAVCTQKLIEIVFLATINLFYLGHI